MKKRILFVINQFFKGGAETALLNLLKVLPEDEFEIDLLIFDHIELSGVVTLLNEIPAWIHVFNASREEGRLAYLKKAAFKLWRNMTHGEQLYRSNVYRFVKDKRYDVAVSFGEWFSCSLVADYVAARRKYVWIHADMDKADFLYPDILTRQSRFDGFIFVSAYSRDAAVAKYPELRRKCLVIHNLVDRQGIEEKSTRQFDCPISDTKLPVLLTVANIRPEKNHPRQVRVMKRLFDRGLRFYWLNVGNHGNMEQLRTVRQAVEEAGLEEFFLLPGAMENPYPLMKKADAVCVLSDHESWSMVITEAKMLGTPVIATKTSGALEQITPEENGLLCEQSDEAIENTLYRFLTEPALGKHIRGRLREEKDRTDDLRAVETLLRSERKKVLYLFDNINYASGARRAALAQMEYLSRCAETSAFSVEPCEDTELQERWNVWDLGGDLVFRSLSTPFRDVLGGAYPLRCKCLRILYALLARTYGDKWFLNWILGSRLSKRLECYDSVCVVSEASKLRACVSSLRYPKKIQWIHTDYAAWSRRSSWTRAITKHDGRLYQSFDVVVCLSERLKERFIGCHPHLSEKAAVIPNLIEYERILQMAEEKPDYLPYGSVMNLVSVGRMEQEKRNDRLLRIAAELKKTGVAFHWYFVGDGALLESMKQLCKRLDLENEVTFTGGLANPYPLMKRCDALVLLSEYEGTPVTIDEAKVLGLPVLTNDVGGVRDQLAGGFGKIISDKKEMAASLIELPLKSNKKEQPFWDAYNGNSKTVLYSLILGDDECYEKGNQKEDGIRHCTSL